MLIRKLVYICLCLFLTACSSKQENAVIINDTLTIPEQMEISFGDIEVLDVVEPPDPKGYFHLFEQQKDYIYLCQKGTIKNIGNTQLNTKQIKLSLSDQKVDGVITLINEDGSNFEDTLSTKETRDFYMVFLIEQKQIQSKFHDQIVIKFLHQKTESDTYDESYVKDIEVNR